MRQLLPIALFFSTAILGMILTHPQIARQEFRPPPTENWLDPDVEERNAHDRKAWINARHRAPPGTDWKQIERQNGINATARRNHPAPPAAINGTWIERGSQNIAGRMHCAELTEDNVLYAGSALGGVWRQRPGAEWEPLGDNLYGGVHWLEVLPADTQGSPPIMIAAADWGYIHRSDDDGQTWTTPTGLPAMSEVRRLLAAPDNTLYLIAGAWGSYTLLRSDDKGQSFNTVQNLGNYPPDLWTPRDNNGPLYLYSQDTLQRSDDQGQSFSPAPTNPNPYQGVWITGNDTAPRVYIIGQNANNYYIQHSDDQGQSWSPPTQLPEFWGALESSRTDPNLVAIGGMEMWISRDAGAQFTVKNHWGDYYGDPATLLHADMMGFDVEKDNQGNEYWFMGTDGGLYQSTDTLQTVQNLSLHGLRVGQYYSTLTSQNGNLAAGAQDQGYQISAGQTPENNIYNLEQIISGDYGHLSSGDNTHDYVFSTYPGFILVQIGETNPSLDYLDFPSGEQNDWLPPVVADPTQPADFYFLASHLYRYTRERQGWSDPALWSQQDFSGNGRHFLTALTFSPLDSNRVYATTDDGRIFISNDHALTWTQSNDNGPSAHYFYGSTLIASHFDINTAYIGGSGYDGPPVYRSQDGGQSWQAYGDGLPNTMVYGLAEARDGSGALAAATETGAYLRTDSSNWEELTGAPITTYWSVETLLTDDSFRFGTYGRGIWDYQMTPPEGHCWPPIDQDGDGVLCDTDCNDTDPNTYPGAPDACDLADQNCDPTEETDQDLDGSPACEDCDDTDPDALPNGDEICGNGKDDDCQDGDLSCEPGLKQHQTPNTCGCNSSPTPLLGIGLIALLTTRRNKKAATLPPCSPDATSSV